MKRYIVRCKDNKAAPRFWGRQGWSPDRKTAINYSSLASAKKGIDKAMLIALRHDLMEFARTMWIYETDTRSPQNMVRIKNYHPTIPRGQVRQWWKW